MSLGKILNPKVALCVCKKLNGVKVVHECVIRYGSLFLLPSLFIYLVKNILDRISKFRLNQRLKRTYLFLSVICLFAFNFILFYHLPFICIFFEFLPSILNLLNFKQMVTSDSNKEEISEPRVFNMHLFQVFKEV